MFQDRTTSRQHIIRFTSVSIETSCRLYFEDTGTVPSRGKSARISVVPLLPAGEVWTGVYAAKQKV